MTVIRDERIHVKARSTTNKTLRGSGWSTARHLGRISIADFSAVDAEPEALRKHVRHYQTGETDSGITASTPA